MSPLPLRILPIGAVVAGLAVAGCGGSGSSPRSPGTTASSSAASSYRSAYGGGGGASASRAGAPASGGQRLGLVADPDGRLFFDRTRLRAPAGRVTIVMRNPSSTGVQHGIAVEGHGVDADGAIVAPGRSSSVSVTLRPGRYRFYCPFDGHRQAGMRGTLIVR